MPSVACHPTIPVPGMKKLLHLAICAVVMFFGARQALEMGDSREWPTTQGQITSARIDKQSVSNPHKGGYSGSSPYRYEVRVSYSYQVDGLPYTGKRLRIRRTSYSNEKLARRELADYPVGQPVKVHYNLEEPESSVLQLH